MSLCTPIDELYTQEQLRGRFARLRLNGDGYVAQCPVHLGPDADLLIAAGRQTLAVRCPLGCSTDEISKIIGLPLEVFEDSALSGHSEGLDEMSRETEGQASPSEFRVIHGDELDRLPPIEFLVEGLLPIGAFGVLYGPPGVGKSFIALSVALAVGSGRPYGARRVKRGSVVYVAAEGAAGLGQRRRAWMRVNNVEGDDGVGFVGSPVNLHDPRDVGRFIEATKSACEAPIRLVILDTFARCFLGGDENSSKDVGRAIASVDRVRRRLDCAVLLIHHAGKNGEERGSSALRGAVDVMLSVKKLGQANRRTIAVVKPKDFAPCEPVHVELVNAGESCVAVPVCECLQSRSELTPDQRQILRTLASGFASSGASSGELGRVLRLHEKTFQRRIKQLEVLGYVTSSKVGRHKRYVISEEGIRSFGDMRQTGDFQATDAAPREATHPLPSFEEGRVSPVPL